MKRIYLILTTFFLTAMSVAAQEYSWESVPVEGKMTGCFSPSKDNVKEAVGYFKGRKYVDPDGNVYPARSIVARTAAKVIEAQPKMARVKDVIAYSEEELTAEYPESALSNWFVDLLMAKTEALTGKKVHVGIVNFGGIRCDMPKGGVILDDLLSMFPFRNTLVYVEHTGKQLRAFLEMMAAHRFEVLGGVRVVAEGGKLLSAEIDGEPIEDDKIYGLATISFLLKGGDGLSLDQNAVSVQNFSNVQIIDAVLEHVYAETAAGRPIGYHTDGRVIVKDLKK